jgi:hypothetical protein
MEDVGKRKKGRSPETQVREKAPHDRRIGCGCCLTLGGLPELIELLRTHALLGIGAPFNARRADGPCVQMAALLALSVGFVAPDLDLLAALLAPDILGLGRTYFCASWTTFFKHNQTLPQRGRYIYDAGHNPYYGPGHLPAPAFASLWPVLMSALREYRPCGSVACSCENAAINECRG